MVDYSDWKACAADEGAPSYVKSAGLPASGRTSPARPFFADQAHGELPCNGRAETWVSARYFSKHAADAAYAGIAADVEYNLRKAAAAYGIVDDVERVMTHHEEVKAASDDDYGYVRPGVRKYPMFDGHGVKLASEYFEENKFKYPFAMRREIAGNILRKAAEYGVQVPDGIRKTAGHGLARPDDVVNELTIRAELCRDPDTALALAKMAEHVAERGVESLDGTTGKIAELVEDTDVIEGWRGRYGRDMTAPEDFLFSMDVKQAEAVLDDVVEVGGEALSLSKLAELPPDTFDNVLGEGFSAAVSENGRIVPRMLGDALAKKTAEDLNELSAALKRL